MTHASLARMSRAVLFSTVLAFAPNFFASSAFAADAPKDNEFLENLTLLKGRVEAARELVRLGSGDLALKRHLGASLNARVGKLEPEFEARKIALPKAELDALVGAAASKDAFAPAAVKALVAIDAAAAQIPAASLKSPKFLGSVLAGLVEHAAVDYKAAVADGKVAVIKEFEEVYGYDKAMVALWSAHVKPALGEASPAGLAANMEKLAAAVPSPVPPATIVTLPPAYAALAKEIAAAAKGLK